MGTCVAVHTLGQVQIPRVQSTIQVWSLSSLLGTWNLCGFFSSTVMLLRQTELALLPKEGAARCRFCGFPSAKERSFRWKFISTSSVVNLNSSIRLYALILLSTAHIQKS